MDNFSASPSEIHTSPDAREVTGERDGGWEGAGTLNTNRPKPDTRVATSPQGKLSGDMKQL